MSYTMVSSINHPQSFWDAKIKTLAHFKPGFQFQYVGATVTFVGEKNGQVEVDHPEHGRCTIDPMNIPNMFKEEGDDRNTY